MTAQELIEALKRANPDAEVCVDGEPAAAVEVEPDTVNIVGEGSISL